MKILVLIPALNEEKYIERTIKNIRLNSPKAAILVVNDGSTDRTKQVVEETGAILLTHPFNLGYGVALQTGYRYALERHFDFIVQLDADGQHETKFIKDLLKPLINNQADLVIGSRFLKYSFKIPFLKNLGVIIFRLLIKIMTNQKITDPTSGYRAFNRKLLPILVTDIYPTDFPDADLLITLLRGGVKIKEIPVKMYQSPKEKKPMHQGLVTLYYVFKVPLSILIGTIRSKKLSYVT